MEVIHVTIRRLPIMQLFTLKQKRLSTCTIILCSLTLCSVARDRIIW